MKADSPSSLSFSQLVYTHQRQNVTQKKLDTATIDIVGISEAMKHKNVTASKKEIMLRRVEVNAYISQIGIDNIPPHEKGIRQAV